MDLYYCAAAYSHFARMINPDVVNRLNKLFEDKFNGVFVIVNRDGKWKFETAKRAEYERAIREVLKTEGLDWDGGRRIGYLNPDSFYIDYLDNVEFKSEIVPCKTDKTKKAVAHKIVITKEQKKGPSKFHQALMHGGNFTRPLKDSNDAEDIDDTVNVGDIFIQHNQDLSNQPDQEPIKVQVFKLKESNGEIWVCFQPISPFTGKITTDIWWDDQGWIPGRHDPEYTREWFILNRDFHPKTKDFLDDYSFDLVNNKRKRINKISNRVVPLNLFKEKWRKVKKPESMS
jgi:hypothetical protein